MFKPEDLSVGLILAIHPRTLFTRIGVYRNNQVVFLKKVIHDKKKLDEFSSFSDQTDFRSDKIFNELKDNDILIDQIKIIISSGGLIRPVKAGIYEINKAIITDLKAGYSGEDVINLGGLIANNLNKRIKSTKAFIVDPVVVDEFDDIARVAGHPNFKRRSVFHALKQKSVARKHAKTILKDYNELNLIVGYFGNGITIGAHKKGKVIDSTQGLDGDGPFSLSRSGTIPVGDLVRICFSGKYTQEEILKMITGQGGMTAYLGTNNGFEIDLRVQNGDKKATFYFRAMAYQVLKSIGSMYAVMIGEVDAIILTGGLTNSRFFVNEIREGLKNFPPVHIYSMEEEIDALATNGFRLLRGEVEISSY